MQARVRFNAKARQGSHKRKTKRSQDKPKLGEEDPDPNAAIVAPKSEEQKEEERRLKLREEVRMCSTYVKMLA